MKAASLQSAHQTENRTLVIITIMLVAILEVLDGTIVNVALPHMMPALGANTEEITWVLTSYIVGSAMMLPLTGTISRRIGHRRLLLVNITGFMLTSFLCGTATSLYEMIFFRLLQGGFGAALIPLSQAILRETFPLQEQGKAMAIWGIGIMAAPVFGPTLGGIIVQYADWRWIFYLNAPICLIGLVMTFFTIKASTLEKTYIDWPGIILMFIGVGALQLFLDQGNSKDWFNSQLILILATASFLGLWLFIRRSLKHPNPLIQFRVFKDRNFTVSTLTLAAFCASVMTIITLQPILLQTLHGYTAIISGITTMPMGIASAVGMILCSALMSRVNVKVLLISGLLFSSAGACYLSQLNLQTAQYNFMIANALAGFGMGLFMVPLSTYALATIDPKDVTEASGLFSYGRMLGTSIGISIFGTLLTRLSQTNWNQLGARLAEYSQTLRQWFALQNANPDSPAALAKLQLVLSKQSKLLAFNDCFIAIAVVLLLLIPCILSMKTVDLRGQIPGAH